MTIGAALGKVLHNRRSDRRFRARWTLAEMSTLLARATGLSLTATRSGKKYRAYPSPGALYANDVHMLIRRVDGIPPGHYLYDPYAHALVRISRDAESPLKSFIERTTTTRARAIAVIVDNPFRTIMKYGDIGYKFSLLEAGMIAENITLVAVALGKCAVPYESYEDGKLNKALGLDGYREFVSLTVLLG